METDTPKPKPKGHWPKGKRRNPDNGDWEIVRLGLTALLDQHAKRGSISIRALADAVGVDGRSVGKWLDGTSRPSLDRQELVRAWLKVKRDATAREKRK